MPLLHAGVQNPRVKVQEPTQRAQSPHTVHGVGENQSTAWVPGKEIVEIKVLERKFKINLNEVIFTTTVCFVVLLRFHLVHLCGSVDHVSQTMWCTCRCIWLKPTIKSSKNCILDLEEFRFLVSSTITNLFNCTWDLCFCQGFYGSSLVGDIDNFTTVLLQPNFVHQRH